MISEFLLSEHLQGEETKEGGILKLQSYEQIGSLGPRAVDDRLDPGANPSFLTVAEQLAKVLFETVQIDLSGGAHWARQDDSPHDLGSLSTGNLGSALFFSALAQSSGRAKYRCLAEACLTPVLEPFATKANMLSYLEHGLGIENGIGGNILGLVRNFEYLADSKLLIAARACAELLTKSHIKACQHVTVREGLAGIILALLEANRVSRDSLFLSKAVMCAEELARRRKRVGCVKVWPQFSMASTVGFYSGIDGIVFALAACGKIGRMHSLVAIAKEARDLERTQNSLQPASLPSEIRHSWSCGEAGILLSRIKCRVVFEEEMNTVEVSRFAQALMRTAEFSEESLVVGEFGFLESMWCVAELSESSNLIAQILSRATSASMRVLARGQDSHLRESTLFDSFFRGLPGIGYQLLRFHDRQQVRSILSILT